MASNSVVSGVSSANARFKNAVGLNVSNDSCAGLVGDKTNSKLYTLRRPLIAFRC